LIPVTEQNIIDPILGRILSMRQKEETFTPSEAAAICRLALGSIQREIDEGPVRKARPARVGDRRHLNKHDLLYLALVRDFEKLLSKHGKELIYKAVRRYSPLSPKSALKERAPVRSWDCLTSKRPGLS
jgi:hypothetical protein